MGSFLLLYGWYILIFCVILYSMNLSQVKNGEYATIIQINTEESVKQRLKMLNVCPNAKVQVVKRSLFKSSLLLEVNGVRLGLRREIAEQIKVLRLHI